MEKLALWLEIYTTPRGNIRISANKLLYELLRETLTKVGHIKCTMLDLYNRMYNCRIRDCRCYGKLVSITLEPRTLMQYSYILFTYIYTDTAQLAFKTYYHDGHLYIVQTKESIDFIQSLLEKYVEDVRFTASGIIAEPSEEIRSALRKSRERGIRQLTATLMLYVFLDNEKLILKVCDFRIGEHGNKHEHILRTVLSEPKTCICNSNTVNN